MNDNSHGTDGKKGNDENQNSQHSRSSHEQRPIIPPRGDYQTLLSWQKAEVVYDITFRFAHKFLSKGDRTVDQMICLIHQTNYLLDQQLKTLEKEFVEQGGLRERMTKARLNYRNQRPGQ